MLQIRLSLPEQSSISCKPVHELLLFKSGDCRDILYSFKLLYHSLIMTAPILTVTLNPAVDTVSFVEQLRPGQHNRVDVISASAGGKGINVSRALRDLGLNSDIYTILAGATGERIRNLLTAENFTPQGITISGENRNCLVLTEPGETIEHLCRETLINEQGPDWTISDRRRMLTDLTPQLTNRDWVVVSGSLPPSLPVTLYRDILRKTHRAGARTILDASGDFFLAALEARPFAIKPNKREICQALELVDCSESTLCSALSALETMGVAFPVISLGAEGALARFQGQSYRVRVFPVPAVITTGCGDAFVAGLLSSLSISSDPVKALRMAARAARANLDNLVPGSLTRPRRRIPRGEITIEKI